MNFCDWFFSFMTHLLCWGVGLILAVFALLLLIALWYLAPWLIVGYVTVILAFLFVSPLRRWQDEYPRGGIGPSGNADCEDAAGGKFVKPAHCWQTRQHECGFDHRLQGCHA